MKTVIPVQEEGYCDICGAFGVVTDTDEGLLCPACDDPCSERRVVSYDTLSEDEQEKSLWDRLEGL